MSTPYKIRVKITLEKDPFEEKVAYFPVCSDCSHNLKEEDVLTILETITWNENR